MSPRPHTQKNGQSRPVAQYRAGAGREHGGHPSSLSRQPPVADCEHPTMDGVERATEKAVVDRAVADPEFQQLTA